MLAKVVVLPLLLLGLASSAHAQAEEESTTPAPVVSAPAPTRPAPVVSAPVPTRPAPVVSAPVPTGAAPGAPAREAPEPFPVLVPTGRDPIGIAPGSAEEVREPSATAVPSAGKQKKKSPKIAWSGRVFVGNALTRREVGGSTFWRNEMGVGAARIGLRYEHPKGLRAVIKLEVGRRDAELRDGYIRLNLPANFRVQAGRFKKQISRIALDSKWDLPSVERGLLDSVTVEGQRLPFAGGRGEGVMLNYRAPTSSKMGASVSVMQNDLGIGDVTLDASEDLAQDFFFRAYAEPVDGLHLASTFAVLGYLSEGTRESFRHAPVGSLEMHYKGKWFRAWAEGFAGKSPFARVDGSTEGNFWAARTLIAPRLRPGVPRRLEPFLGASVFDPRTTDTENANYELQGGVNLAFAKEWRLQFELSQVYAEGLSSSAIESTAFYIQLGARFKD